MKNERYDFGERPLEEYGDRSVINPRVVIERGILSRLIDAGLVDYGPGLVSKGQVSEYSYIITEEGKQWLLDHLAV